MTRNKGITIHLVNLTSFMSFFAKWLALSCYRHCTVHTSESSQITVLNGGGFGLAPLGYWLCLAWRRLGLAINPLGLGYGRLATGCAWLGAAWVWLLIRLGLAMAAWAWLWLCLAWCRLAIGCAWLGGAWAWLLIRLGLAMSAWLLAVLGLVLLGFGY